MNNHEDDIKSQIKDIDSGKANGFYGEYTIICPWCGYEEYRNCEKESHGVDGEHNEICDVCEMPFILETSIEITYSTKRIESEGESDD